jgi:predicted dehydrogenase
LRSSILQIGFIGGGINSAVGHTHKIAAEMDGRWKLAAGAFSRDSDVNHETAKLWGVDSTHAYTCWRDLLAQEKDRLDAVAILTPTPLHTEMVVEALNQGYPVICEKSLATSSAEVGKIKRSLQQNRGFLAVTYNYSGYPMLRELKRLILSGMLGKVEQIHAEMPQEGFLRLNKLGQPNTPQAWRLKDTGLPTLSLDLGVHLHHMIHFLTDKKPIEVVAHQNSLGLFRHVIDNVICIARYTDDLVCSIWYGKAALGHRNGLKIRVFGDKGAAEWYQMEPELLHLADNQGRQSLIDRSSIEAGVANQSRYGRFKVGHPSGFIEAFANYYVDMADSLESYLDSDTSVNPYVYGAEIAEEGLLMLEAVSKSVIQKQWVSLKADVMQDRAIGLQSLTSDVAIYGES